MEATNMKEMYNQFSFNVEVITYGRECVTEEMWVKLIDKKNISDVFDIVMPTKNVAKKYNITHQQYIELYCSDTDQMSIKERRKTMDCILSGKLNNLIR